MKRFQVDERRCSGCRACMVACVFEHEGHFGVATARLYVAKIDTQGLDRPHVCRQCPEPACVAACPNGALVRDKAAGAVCLQEDDCVACGSCAEACPFGAIRFHPRSGQPLFCDLCGGDPACVKRCATGAIGFLAPAQVSGFPGEGLDERL